MHLPKRNRWAPGLILGVLLVSACVPGQPAAVDRPQARVLHITMQDYRFVPDRLVLRRGQPYRLIFANRAKSEWHEFTARKFLRSAALGNPNVLDSSHSELAVPPGAVRELDLVPRKAGRYRFYCSDHDWAGMDGRITVE